MDSELVVLHYESPAAAEGAMATIHGLVAEGFVELEDAAFISRDADGWVTVKPADSGEPARHAAFGGALGLLAGGLMGLPVLGVLAGAGVAAKMSSHADHLEELISSVGRQMTAGTGVLALTVRSLDDPEIVADRLDVHRDQLIRADIPADLKARIDEQARR